MLIIEGGVMDYSQFIPKGYDARDYQIALLKEIINAFKVADVVILEAPTGWGKSVLAKALCNYYGLGYISSAEKILQDQYAEMYPELPCLKGKSNYWCEEIGGSAAEAPCQVGMGCRVRHCEYREIMAKIKLNDTDAIVNHVLMLLSKKLPEKNISIFDESHTLESVITTALTIVIDNKFQKSLNKCLELCEDKKGSIAYQEVSFALEAVNYILHRLSNSGMREGFFEVEPIVLNEVKGLIDEVYEHIGIALQDASRICEAAPNMRHCRLKLKLTNMTYVYTSCMMCDPIYDIIIDKVNGVRRYHISAMPYTIKGILQSQMIKADRMLVMSATIGDPEIFADIHGIKKYKFIPAKSRFSTLRRPLCVRPHDYISSKVMLDDDRIDRYLTNVTKDIEVLFHRFGNGVVHAGTYRMAGLILPYIERLNVNLHYHTDASDREEVVNNFIEQGGILLTASVYQGIDFKDELARWQIILKVPYMSMTTNYVRKKMSEGKWYQYNTAIKIAQAYGRAVRHKKDYAVTVVTDGTIDKIIDLLPKYVQEATFRVTNKGDILSAIDSRLTGNNNGKLRRKGIPNKTGK